jgi:signal transduction histidine kinase
VAAAPKRVMILNPHSRDTAPFSALAASFRATLAAEVGGPVSFQEIPLDLAKSDDSGNEPLVRFLQDKLVRENADLVVPLGGIAARFTESHRERLFPDTPILMAGVEPRLIPPHIVEKNTTYVTQAIDLPGMVRQILTMKPETKHIAVVFGSTELEKLWASICRREFAAFSQRVEFIWLDGLPLAEMLDRCSKLPPDSFIFHGLFIEDANGIPCEKSESLRRLREVANAPVFSFFSSELGLGTVGGYLYQNEEVGKQAAHIAVRILRGEAPQSIPPQIIEPGAPIYDWRELQRWNIRESHLPQNRIIRFREPGFWERYHWPVIGTGVFFLIQAALILKLLMNRKRLQQAVEAQQIAMRQTIELRETLAHTGRVSLMGQLASALAHELSQPLGAILRNTEAAEMMLQQTAPDSEEMRSIVEDVLRDVHRAGDVIHKLRSLLGKGELKLQPLELPEVIRDVLTLLKSDAMIRHVRFTVEIPPDLPAALGDRIHLQQVLLNLIVNAMDALDAQADRQVCVFARLIDPATLAVRVCDNGPGMPEEKLGRLFESFYTTKASGMGMGLAVSKTIIEAHKGKLTAENQPAGGACFSFTLQTAPRKK